MPKFYVIFARMMPEFYMMIAAQKNTCPLPPVSYAYGENPKVVPPPLKFTYHVGQCQTARTVYVK